ncbi:MAG: 16S rRNA (cytidine(1402)-2'-O)-methyltransferase [Moraxella sp.]
MNNVGTLYIVATPIGNLSDMTQRAIDTLKMADIIACEDTRTSARLLNFFNIDTSTLAYHEHNADSQTQKLIDKLLGGQSVALISDAGTPLVSDPGFRLVTAALENGILCVPVVGACAVIGALQVAGLPSDKFSFLGFLPAKQTARQDLLQNYKERSETLIFYEAPHRIVDSLADMVMIFGENRVATLCRELTKTFETVKKLPLNQLYEFVKNDPYQQKGEIVLVVAGNTKKTVVCDYDDWLLRIVKDLPPKKAAAVISDVLKLKKSDVYQRYLELHDKKQ